MTRSDLLLAALAGILGSFSMVVTGLFLAALRVFTSRERRTLFLKRLKSVGAPATVKFYLLQRRPTNISH